MAAELVRKVHCILNIVCFKGNTSLSTKKHFTHMKEVTSKIMFLVVNQMMTTLCVNI